LTGVDTNILVYAHLHETPWHHAAFRCMQSLAESSAPWAIPWPCVHEFLSVVTSPRIYKTPSPLSVAIGQIDLWLECPTMSIIGETEAHWSTLTQLLIAGKIAGPMVHDARIMAICKQHGVTTFWSADRDFSRFTGVKIVNPLHG